MTRDDTRGRQGEPRHRRPNWGKRSPSRSSSRSPSPRGRKVRFDDDNENVKVCNTCTIFRTEGLDVMSNNCVPMVTTSYGKPQTSSMPTSSGRLGNISVSVLRDTGCSGVVVKHALIDSKSLNGKTQVCVLADGNKVEVPMADLYIDTPYFVGGCRSMVYGKSNI